MSIAPDTLELLEAARRALAEDVAPSLSGDARYQVLLAANAIATAARELSTPADVVQAQAARIAALIDSNASNPDDLERELAEAIRAGRFDEPARHAELFAVLRDMTRRTLESTNPKVAAKRFG